jgi:hypothetical protein
VRTPSHTTPSIFYYEAYPMNIALPSTPRRAGLRAFWFVVIATAGLLVAVLAGSLGWPRPIATGVLVATLLMTVVFLQQRFVWLCYRAWNRLLVYPFLVISRNVATRLCYFIVFVAVGRTGSRLPLTGSDTSGGFWTLRSSPDLRAYRLPFGPDHGQLRSFGWVCSYVSWAFHSGNTWAVALLPFLAILWVCSGPQEGKIEANIYTLF